MEAIGLALSVAAAADLCLKYGNKLIYTYRTLKNARSEIEERILHVANKWNRINEEIEVVKDLEHLLTETHRDLLADTLKVLLRKLEDALSKLNSLLKRAPRDSQQQVGFEIKRARYFFLKPYLDEVIDDLNRWAKDFEPQWWLQLKVSSASVDVLLADKSHGSRSSPLASAAKIRQAAQDDSERHVFLPPDGIKDAAVTAIPYCSARYVQRPGSSKWLVIDTIKTVAFANPKLTIKDVRTLASQLSSIDPTTFGLLRCHGVVKLLEEDKRTIFGFDFVFETPQNIVGTPATLRSHLLSGTTHTLTQRFNIAMQLAKSVCYVHTLGFVHKNLRPENILSFSSKDRDLETSFLIGFDQARLTERGTVLEGYGDWNKNLYQHPDRQGLEPREAYVMQHDIYSLGVCLLEIGLWKSFVNYGDDEGSAVPGSALQLSPEDLIKRPRINMKDQLVEIARDDLAQLMGEIYQDIVVNCLTCLDVDNADFGNESEFQDADGVEVGVRYVEKILSKLNSLSV